MTNDNFSSRQIAGLTVALLLHAALLSAVLLAPANHQVVDTAPAGKPILWLKITPAKPPAIPPRLARKPHPTEKKIVKNDVPALASAAVAPERADVPMAPAPVSVAEMMRLAKQDLRKIDRELRKEAAPRTGMITGAVESPAQRLARSFDEAHAAAPQKWYQAARVEDITPPGNDARKIYRVTTAFGSYCVRYPDKNKIAQTGAANFGAPLVGACPHMF